LKRNPFGDFGLSLVTRSEWSDQFMLCPIIKDPNIIKAAGLEDHINFVGISSGDLAPRADGSAFLLISPASLHAR
jgi:hypothetical protein